MALVHGFLVLSAFLTLPTFELSHLFFVIILHFSASYRSLLRKSMVSFSMGSLSLEML